MTSQITLEAVEPPEALICQPYPHPILPRPNCTSVYHINRHVLRHHRLNQSIYPEQSSPQAGQTLASIMQTILDETNVTIKGIVPPLSVEQRPTTTANRSALDELYVGLTLFTLLSVGVFVLANVLPKDKQLGCCDASA